MITINDLSVQFGGKFLFESINFKIAGRDRIGLTGFNGSGKSSLLKLLNGNYKADTGNINIPKGYSIGYLEQEIQALKGSTVMEETSKAFQEVLKLQERLLEVEKAVEETVDFESDGYMDLLEELNAINERLPHLGADTMDADIQKVLKGLGFQDGDFDRLTDEFSGGWQMRIELAKLLLRRPNLLLLDEPTNHLDIESIQWLERFLCDYYGAMIVVSHDRAFLDVVTNRTIEISSSKIYDYKASYTKYVIMRAARKEQQVLAKKNQDKYIKGIERNIEKFRAKKNKAKFAQTLIRKLDNMERIEVDEDEIRAMNLRFPDAPHSGKEVLKLKNISKAYGDHLVLDNVNLNLNKGERIAFVGKNGEGKTTLTKILVSQIDYEGEYKLGHNVSIGYFAQHQTDLLDGNKTIFQTIDDMATGELRYKVRGLLGAFLFSGDDADKKVKILSGGEKARVALAKLLLEPVNLLIMDEPTNHLDMLSKDILKQALLNFKGTLIIVSHDREFLKGLSDRTYEFKNKNIKEYIGDIYNFLAANEVETFKEFELQKRLKSQVPIHQLTKSQQQESQNQQQKTPRHQNLS